MDIDTKDWKHHPDASFRRWENDPVGHRDHMLETLPSRMWFHTLFPGANDFLFHVSERTADFLRELTVGSGSRSQYRRRPRRSCSVAHRRWPHTPCTASTKWIGTVRSSIRSANEMFDRTALEELSIYTANGHGEHRVTLLSDLTTGLKTSDSRARLELWCACDCLTTSGPWGGSDRLKNVTRAPRLSLQGRER